MLLVYQSRRVTISFVVGTQRYHQQRGSVTRFRVDNIPPSIYAGVITEAIEKQHHALVTTLAGRRCVILRLAL